jgi:hypothetical protein
MQLSCSAAIVAGVVVSSVCIAGPTVITEAGDVAYVRPDGSMGTARHVLMTKGLCVPGATTGDAALRDAADAALARLRTPVEAMHVVESRRDGARGPGGGPAVVFNVLTPAPAGALAVLQTVADTYAASFDDVVTINLNISFDPEGFGVAATSLFFVNYADARAFMIAAADPDDSVQALLPGGSLPIIDILGGPTRTEGTAIVASSLAKAWGQGPTAAVDADLTIGTDAPGAGVLDFDVSNGVQAGQFSAVDIITHEVGHALGFLSSVGRFEEPMPLDFFRFRDDQAPTDALGFGTTPRFFDSRFFVNNSHVFVDLGVNEGLSNNSNFQSSHWRDRDADPIGTMDPRIQSGTTLSPALLTPADLAAFDSIGWDRIGPTPAACNAADVAAALGVLDVNDIIEFVNAFNAGGSLADVAPAGGDGMLNVNDVITFVNAFNAGCP